MDSLEASLQILKLISSGDSFEKMNCEEKCNLVIKNFKKIYSTVEKCTKDDGCEPDEMVENLNRESALVHLQHNTETNLEIDTNIKPESTDNGCTRDDGCTTDEPIAP